MLAGVAGRTGRAGPALPGAEAEGLSAGSCGDDTVGVCSGTTQHEDMEGTFSIRATGCHLPRGCTIPLAKVSSSKLQPGGCVALAALLERYAITSAPPIVRNLLLILSLFISGWFISIYFCANAIILASKAVLPLCYGPPPPGVFIQANHISY